jgi:hypothetical protein
MINGKDASNASAIKQSGLNVSVDHIEGLEYMKGSLETFTGTDIEPVTNGVWKNGTHVFIMVTRENRIGFVIYDSTV